MHGVAVGRARPLRISLIILTAIALIAAAGFVGRRLGHHAKPPQVAKPRVTVYRHHSQVVYLEAPKPMQSDPEKGIAVPLLVRELFRQSLLMAARDELGLYTRDAVLEESPPADKADASLRCDLSYVSGNRFSVTAGEAAEQNGPPTDSPVRYEGELQAMNIVPLVDTAERYSRGVYADLLKGDGFAAANKPLAPTTRPDQGDLAAAQGRLEELTEASQFAAVRAAHEALRSAARGPWASILVRGYANLGQLTWPYLNATHEVFVARALLYAQRMVSSDPRSPDARWARAYARALVGLHGAALEDLAEADRLARQSGVTRPGWAELIEPLCRYQTARLADLAVSDARRAPLAMFLCFLTVEHCGSRADVIETAKTALKVNPLCMRLIESMSDMSGVGYLHVLTEMGPAEFRGSLPGQLGRLADLPSDATRALATLRGNPQDVPANADLVRSLVGDTEDVEPSWGALGGMIRETHFMHVCRRAYFMSTQWSVDASDYVNSQAPLVEGHPYQALIDYYAATHADPAARQRAGERLIAFDFPDVRLSATRLYFALSSLVGNRHQATRLLWLNLQQAADPGAYDQEILMFPFQLDSLERNKPMTMVHAQRLREISPFSPIWMAASVLADWENARGHVDEWQKLAPGYPILTAALGRRYAGAGDYADAAQCLRAYLRVGRDAWAYRMLADSYSHLGDEAKWLQVMNESLGQEDYGLDHAMTQSEMARHYMDKRQYQEALPHALAAAESGSEWGLNSAAECYEGLKDWENAEQYVAASATRYYHPDNWYFWCQRTGRGHLDRAATAMGQYVDSLKDSADYGDRWRLPAFYLLEGDDARAERELARNLEQFGDPWAGLHLALLKLRAGDRPAAATVLKTVAERGPAFRFNGSDTPWTELLQFVAIVRQRMSRDPGAKFDLPEIDRLIAASGDGDRATLNYFAAKYLEALDGAPQAGDYLRRSAAAGYQGNVNVLLALQDLRHQGASPPDHPPDPAATAPAVSH